MHVAMDSNPVNGGELTLTDTHRMLLRMRDALYEGSWEDFARDLRARAEGQPHVFETVPTSLQMRATIKTHLAMIEQMRAWEDEHDRTLSVESDGESGE
ncbi:MAG: hypothetical protein PVI86_05195 [Phycisphaerae bacterium]|jgi:hypothetical protein